MMEIIILAVLAVGVWHAISKAHQSNTGRQQQRRVTDEATLREQRRVQQKRARESREYNKKNSLARHVQTALLQLEQAPDFQRAAHIARLSKAVPKAFRQRQFVRFRSLLVQHMRRRLDAGTDPDLLLSSLRELVEALSVSPFEANYIYDEAERRRIPTRRRTPNFTEDIERVRRDHQERIEALQNLNDVEADLREQMIEAETERFRSVILELGSPQAESPL